MDSSQMIKQVVIGVDTNFKEKMKAKIAKCLLKINHSLQIYILVVRCCECILFLCVMRDYYQNFRCAYLWFYL